MTVADRKKQLRIVAEMLLVHLPALLNPRHAPPRGASAGDQTSQADQPLIRDLLTVVSLAIRAAADDAEKSAVAWDKRAYDLRADELRREWEWASGAANYRPARPITPLAWPTALNRSPTPTLKNCAP
jgi:hypothetical protein